MMETLGSDSFEKKDLTPSYELSPRNVELLIYDLLDKNKELTPENSSEVIIRVDGNSEYADIARYIEETVFMREFGNSPQEMEREYNPYEKYSDFYIAIDCEANKPIAALRVIKNSENGLKTLNDATKEPFNVNSKNIEQHNKGMEDLNKVWDIGTVAKMPGYTRSSATVELYRAVYVASLNSSIEDWVTIIDDAVHNMTTKHFGIPFEPLGDSEPGPYLGSDKSHVVCAHVPDFRETMGDHMSKAKGRLANKIFGILVNGDSDNRIILSPIDN
ncbi:MAG: hypothetical protein PWQ10_46 [Patescibacteria group bacterium]|nr:hypothetical protein [Patescibacteria group bacterium]